ncbi:septation protein A [Alcaligenes endophyticus]|uniref:Inner membrane-spanning protein YciB n=1 Tax=Alcaligenes endophyticus TaxID=1929088 RepID=A0ABT8EHL7_9BURK|nr:septation protein A [Alcaligenes endophyticus]MCX5592141.1 septation protein A [Alcaligenes endophyticus]MDN4120788.1 septation protein A [Alcaligenes endophyticus]
MKKLLFDLFPLVLFFIVFRFADIYAATAVAMAASVAQILWLKFSSKKIEGSHWINLAIIVVFGGATLLFQSDVFIKWKPTVLYWVFACVLLGGRYLMGRNLMQKLMGAQLTLPEPLWDKLNLMWSGFFIFAGIVNLYVAFSGHFTESQWVNFKVFGLMVLLLVFVVIQSVWLSRHMKDQTDQAD